MRYSSRTHRIIDKTSSAWDTHIIATEMIARGDDAIILTIGDTDFSTPSNVVPADYQSMLDGRTHYTASIDEKALREAIALRHSSARWAVSAEEVVVTIGAQNALLTATLSLVDAGDEVIVPEPMYTTYPGTIALSGATVVSVPSPAENGAHPLVEKIEAAVTFRTKAIFIATPNNPTGAVYTADELSAIGEICRNHDLWLVSDEVYGDLVYDGTHVPAATVQGLEERTVTIGSLPKSHAMTGWRLGWLIAPAEFAAHAGRISACATFGIPTFIQDAAIIALEMAPQGAPGLREAYAERRRLFCDRLNQIPGLACHRPEGGMFVMLDVWRTDLTAYDFAMKLLHEQKVAVLPADGLGPSTAGYLRVNLGVPEDLLNEAANRINRFCQGLLG